MGKKAREGAAAAGGPFDLRFCCDEAQADGVPCTELGRDCETCEKAVRVGDPRDEAPGTDETLPSSGA